MAFQSGPRPPWSRMYLWEISVYILAKIVANVRRLIPGQQPISSIYSLHRARNFYGTKGIAHIIIEILIWFITYIYIHGE